RRFDAGTRKEVDLVCRPSAETLKEAAEVLAVDPVESRSQRSRPDHGSALHLEDDETAGAHDAQELGDVAFDVTRRQVLQRDVAVDEVEGCVVELLEVRLGVQEEADPV